MAEHVGPFQIQDGLPALERPRLLLCLRPWVDVGSVSTMALTFLEEAWGSRRLAQLTRPGVFYDFTRYRPTLHRREGQRIVTVPNTFLNHARSPDGQDWLFLHALEPHSHGDDYAEAVFQLMQRLGVAEYAMVGAMYAPVPHTRPPTASGSASDDAMRDRLQRLGVRESSYEGPTTIMAVLPAVAAAGGIQTMTVILQMPAGRRLADQMLLRAPVFGSLLERLLISRFARTLGTLLSSGVPILSALETVRGTVTNRILDEALQDVERSLKVGESLARPMELSGVFPPLVTRMIALGEETGQLDRMLMQVADSYEEEVEVQLAGLTQLLEPLLIVFVGGVVGFIVIAMFLPLMSLTKLLG